ncbi:terminase large subunit [Methylosinus sp. LW4]|uniref:terminase large subunit n=1 Tax=Methylosinus sp. LW4 TaxID=136993 RepID=UPI00035CD7CC|nr:terminase large subunit [Methylosinus sp. LW4]
MTAEPWWTTACIDWERRIVEGRSLLPCGPLFPDEAAAWMGVFANLRLVDLPGSPTIGQACREWITDFAAFLFGGYDPDLGVRYINDIHLDIAKKNIKSTFAAAVFTTCMVRNWRPSAELNIAAPTKEIADNSFLPSRDMIAADPDLRALFHVKENQRVIEHRNTRAVGKVVAADSETVGGKKSSVIIFDELWLFGMRAGSEAMLREAKGGIASRNEGFLLTLSTKPDGPPRGVYAQRLEYFRGVRDGKIHDPHSFGLIYEYPPAMIKDGTYAEPRFFYIPNPNLGASVSEQYLISEMGKAARAGKASLANFHAKHLNVEPSIALRSDGWAGLEVWSRGRDRTLTLDSLLERCEVVTVGIDGGGLDDLLGLAVCGRERETGRWLIWAHGLVSTIGVERRKKNAIDYLRFAETEELTVFEFTRGADGVYGLPEDSEQDAPSLLPLPLPLPLPPSPSAEPETEESSAVAALLARALPASDDPNALPPDIAYIVALVARIRDLGLLAQVGVDAAGIGSIVDALAAIGVTQDAGTLDAVRQGIGLMGAIKTAERMLAARRLLYPQSALLDWCVGNLRIIPTATAMRVARDESGFGKIDPAIAVFNAIALMSMNPEAQNSGASIYDAEENWTPSDAPESETALPALARPAPRAKPSIYDQAWG